MSTDLASVVVQWPESGLHLVERLNLVAPVILLARKRPSEDGPTGDDIAVVVRLTFRHPLGLFGGGGGFLTGKDTLKTGRHKLVRHQPWLLGVCHDSDRSPWLVWENHPELSAICHGEDSRAVPEITGNGLRLVFLPAGWLRRASTFRFLRASGTQKVRIQDPPASNVKIDLPPMTARSCIRDASSAKFVVGIHERGCQFIRIRSPAELQTR